MENQLPRMIDFVILDLHDNLTEVSDAYPVVKLCCVQARGLRFKPCSLLVYLKKTNANGN